MAGQLTLCVWSYCACILGADCMRQGHCDEQSKYGAQPRPASSLVGVRGVKLHSASTELRMVIDDRTLKSRLLGE